MSCPANRGEESADDPAVLRVRLKPGAKRNGITVNEDGTLAVAVTSRPIEGRANTHLVKLLSRALRVPISSCGIARGKHSRTKLVAVTGPTTEQALRILRELPHSGR